MRVAEFEPPASRRSARSRREKGVGVAQRVLLFGRAAAGPADPAALPACALRGEREPSCRAVHGKLGARLWAKPQSHRPRRKKRVGVAQRLLLFGRAAAGPAGPAALPACALRGERETE